jgi:ABC-type branched-subunit amino acid transport system substrate-binding protein
MRHRFHQPGPAIRCAVLAVTVIGVAACGSTSSGGSGSKSTYTVTVNTGLSGPNEAGGIPSAEGFEAYMAKINKTGGVNGHHINVIVVDDAGSVPTGLSNYQAALASDSLGFFQTNASANVAAIGDKAVNDHIAIGAVSAYHGAEGTFPYVYNEAASQETAFSSTLAFAVHLVPNPSNTPAAFIAYDSTLTEALKPALATAASAKGFNIVYSQLVPRTSVDFSVAAGAIATANPAILITSILDTQITTLVTQVRQHGYMGPIVNFNTPITDASLRSLNDKNVYVVAGETDPTDTGDADVAAMLKSAIDTNDTNSDNNTNFVLAYVFAEAVADAIGKCGDNCTRESFNAALETTTVNAGTLMASPGFTKTDHDFIHQLGVFTWDNAHGYAVPVSGFGL